MSLQIGTLLCLLTIPFAAVNSLHHALAQRPVPGRKRIHAVNLIVAIGFSALAAGTQSSPGDTASALVFARLWLPIVYFWWAYAWAGHTLHLFHPPEFSYDRPLINVEQRLFGNPSLWLGRNRPAWLNELMQISYWLYLLYTPFLGIALYSAGDFRRFEAMALAVCLGYAISYSAYPWMPLWGPRWALVSEGLLPEDERRLPGYLISGWTHRIMWSSTAHKGGAMPSAHSSTCLVFIVWCWRIWGASGAVAGGVVGGLMFVSTVYGRYHYVVDVLVGVAVGLVSLVLADLLVL
ncbi:MAG TPA: phosphatase PAP2 family protein [Acidobacteriota bacterium]|nr:phosphatase PAP2 family protein [Acidobacteriota bacterium]